VRYTFEYDALGQLIRVRDAHGNATTIERATDGSPIAIVSPYDQRTTLGLRPDGYLTSVTDPIDHSIGLSYDANGSFKKGSRLGKRAHPPRLARHLAQFGEGILRHEPATRCEVALTVVARREGIIVATFAWL
jgi:YD repeat-containing protein